LIFNKQIIIICVFFLGFIAGVLYSIAKIEQQKPIKPAAPVYIPLSNKEIPTTMNNTSEIQSNPTLNNKGDNNTVINVEDKTLSE
jgi:hypothetical protein